MTGVQTCALPILNINIGAGRWQQWEVYWKSNTPGQANGTTRIFLNGTLVSEAANVVLNGNLDMTGAGVWLGGQTYTKIAWYSAPPAQGGHCAQNLTEVNFDAGRDTNFNNPCTCANQCSPNGFVPVFHRYVDDIIVLKK